MNITYLDNKETELRERLLHLINTSKNFHSLNQIEILRTGKRTVQFFTKLSITTDTTAYQIKGYCRTLMHDIKHNLVGFHHVTVKYVWETYTIEIQAYTTNAKLHSEHFESKRKGIK